MRSTSFYHVCDSGFILTGFIFAMSALQSFVGAAPESLRMFSVNNFPVNQHHCGSEKQTPAEKVRNEEHRGKHHEMSPVINAAVDAAFILHNACLKRTKDQNTDRDRQQSDNSHKYIVNRCFFHIKTSFFGNEITVIVQVCYSIAYDVSVGKKSPVMLYNSNILVIIL